MNLSDSLNGGYAGLYGEVVEFDSYRISKLDFVPDVIFDLGANIGVFARYARELFPLANIVCVEPNSNNFEILKEHCPSQPITLINKGIGIGKLWRCLGAANGAHEVYISEGNIGYPVDLMEKDQRMTSSAVETIAVTDIFREHFNEMSKALIKIDIEGNETTIFSDKKSMECLSKCYHIAMEVHPYALEDEMVHSVKDVAKDALEYLSQFFTDIKIEGVLAVFSKRKM